MHSKLTITSASSAVALTTLERVKSELGIAGQESDGLLTTKIGEASSDIESYIDRVLRQETVTQLFWDFRGCSFDGLILDRYPVASISSVTRDDVLVDGAEYRVIEESGLLYRLTADGYPSKWNAGKAISVESVAGYKLPGEAGRNLPAVIEAACVELVSSFWTARGRDPLIRAEDVPGVGRVEYWVGSVGATGSLPPSVEEKITPFRRPVIG